MAFQSTEKCKRLNPKPGVQYMQSDIVHQHDDGTWWFYDESWAFEDGPYMTRKLASDALQTYAEGL